MLLAENKYLLLKTFLMGRNLKRRLKVRVMKTFLDFLYLK